MKTSRLILLAACLLASVAAAGADTIAEARALASEREFDKAAAMFEKVAQTSPPSAAVFFELGRAYADAGDTARAALNFQRALLLDPAFSPARSALAKARTDLAIPAPPATWISDLSLRIPMDPLAWAGTVLFWIGAFLFLAGAYAVRKTGKLILATFLIILAAALLGAVWLTDPRVHAVDAACILSSSGATLLDSPAEQSEKVASLPQGSMIRILSQRGRWFYAQTSTGAKGWLPTEGIVPLVPAS